METRRTSLTERRRIARSVLVGAIATALAGMCHVGAAGADTLTPQVRQAGDAGTSYRIFPFAGGIGMLGSGAEPAGQKVWEMAQTGGTEWLYRDLWPVQNLGAFAPTTLPEGMATAGRRLLFTVPVALPESAGTRLMATDGTALGTEQLTTGPLGGEPENVVAYGNGVLFGQRAADGTWKGWYSDGTAAGTRLIGPEPVGGIAVIGGRAYFGGRVVESDLSTTHAELWATDGTSAGTVPVTSFGTATSVSVTGVADGGRVYFTVYDPDVGSSIWIMEPDGSIHRVWVPPDGYHMMLAQVSGPYLYFELMPSYDYALGEEATLYRTDGTAAGTIPLREFFDNSWLSSPQQVEPLAGGGLLFDAGTKALGKELWCTDGTVAGTQLVKDINPVSSGLSPDDGSMPLLFTRAGGHVYFTAYDPEHGTELWQTDGSAAGTVLAADVVPGPTSVWLVDLQVIGDQLYFRNGYAGGDLWSATLPASDATAQPRCGGPLASSPAPVAAPRLLPSGLTPRPPTPASAKPKSPVPSAVQQTQAAATGVRLTTAQLHFVQRFKGKGKVTWTLTVKRSSGGSAKLATRTLKVTRARSVTVTLKLSANARRDLRRWRKGAVTLTTSFTPSGRKAIRRSQRVPRH